MRTTLTIDDDVAAALERLQKSRKSSLKLLVNEALRRGIRDMTGKPTPREPYRMRPVDLGRALVNIEDVSEALAIAEGEDFK